MRWTADYGYMRRRKVSLERYAQICSVLENPGLAMRGNGSFCDSGTARVYGQHTAGRYRFL